MNDKNGKRKNLLDIDRQKKGMDKKGNETSIFRPIKCLPIMWEVFTRILAEQVYGHV